MYLIDFFFSSSGFSNSNMNLPGREEQGSTTSSPQLQDKNANHRTSSPNSPIPAPVENGNQISNGNLQKLVVSEKQYVLNLLESLVMESLTVEKALMQCPLCLKGVWAKALCGAMANHKSDSKIHYSYPLRK